MSTISPSFLLCLICTHSLLYPIFGIPPTFLLMSHSSSHSPPIFPVPDKGGEAGMGSGQCFPYCRSWHISGSRNQFSGSLNQFKGSWPEFFFWWTRIKSNRTVSIKHSKEKYYLRNYICACMWGPWVAMQNVSLVVSHGENESHWSRG